MKINVNFRFFFWIKCTAIFITVPAPCTAERSAEKRIQQELKLIKANLDPGFSVSAHEKDVYRWEAIMKGPAGSPYEGGKFKLDIRFPMNYPDDPPIIKFRTSIYHPNIDTISGEICISILKKDNDENLNWSPSLRMSQVFLAIYTLLSQPNGDDPLNKAIGREFIKQKNVFEETARRWTVYSAFH